MSLYPFLVGLHVITAILGLGPLLALAVLTTRSAATPWPPDRLGSLLRLAGWSLVVMLASGAGLIALTRGALGETGWMRVSFALFLVLGFLHGLARRRFRRWAQAKETSTAPALAPIFWSMCALVTVITYLMEAKPW